jgi:virginiamycin A acetyltransferase
MTNLISTKSKISKLADIEESVRGTRVLISDGCVIDSFVKIKVAGGMGDVFIGENTYINSGTVLYSGNGIKIGSNVLIAANCTLAPTNHCTDDRNIPIRLQGFAPSKGGILIEDDVWIGCNVSILDGSVIKKGAIIAAGSVVRGFIPEFSIFAGNPGKVIAERK